jgi:hypothetical protein
MQRRPVRCRMVPLNDLREVLMHAKPGDRLVIMGTHLGEPVRDAEILEVHGEDGGPPFLVRWSDDGHETLVYPGPDAHIAAAQ